jgi:hypothetical protein
LIQPPADIVVRPADVIVRPADVIVRPADVVVRPADDEDDKTYGLDTAQQIKLIESQYDVTDLGRTCQQLAKLVMANHYDTFHDQADPLDKSVGAGRYEGPPDMQLLPKDAPVNDESRACEILGLKEPGVPLEGMVYPLTGTQLTAAASMWDKVWADPGSL